jgi:hypothetical protein
LIRNDAIYVTNNRTKPSDWKLSDNSKARAYSDTTGAPLKDISDTIRGSFEGKYDAGCWALLLGGPPIISKQPTDTVVGEVRNATFKVEANGSEPLNISGIRTVRKCPKTLFLNSSL